MLLLVNIMVYSHTFYDDLDPSLLQFWTQGTYFALLIALFLVVLHFSPHKIVYVVPLTMIFIGYAMAEVVWAQEEYRMNEYMLAWMCLHFLLVILIPTQWKLNSLIFWWSCVYLPIRIYITFNVIPLSLLFSLFTSAIYFTVWSSSIYQKLEDLNIILLNNQRLIQEMRRILEIFPHGVLIQSSIIENSLRMVNRNFKKHIRSISHNSAKLKQIEVSFDDSGERKESLFDVLKDQISNLRDSDVKELNNVTIKWSDQPRPAQLFERIESGAEWAKKFNVKTFNINWEGNPSYMHVFIDITDIQKLEEANNNIRCQKIMFASVSHEFRTPLNAIMHSYSFIDDQLQSIKKGDFKSENEQDKTFARINKFLKMGKNSSILLLSLVEDILSLSKMEAGTFNTSMTQFSIEELVSEVSDVFEMQCHHKNIRLVIDIDDSLTGMRAISDHGRIKQILLNLLSNALKFTFKGSISVTVSKQVVEGELWVFFIVADTGIGIRKEDHHHLFSLFGKLPDADQINSNGSGIGLTISRKYCETLGGKIWLESEQNEGTKVSFYIPIMVSRQFKFVCHFLASSGIWQLTWKKHR